MYIQGHISCIFIIMQHIHIMSHFMHIIILHDQTMFHFINVHLFQFMIRKDLINCTYTYNVSYHARFPFMHVCYNTICTGNVLVHVFVKTVYVHTLSNLMHVCYNITIHVQARSHFMHISS